MSVHHEGSTLNTTSYFVRRSGGVLLITEAILAFLPLAILGPAIGWPASLGEPAAIQLAAIAAKPEAVRFGYSVYLLYSILILPVMALLARHVLRGNDDGSRALASSVVGFAAASALARCIGILRWLTVMPLLAHQHAVGSADDRLNIERLFDTVNAYGGGIGELLGVSIFMAFAMLALLLPAWHRRSMPRVLIISGVLSALALAALLMPSLGGPDFMPIAVAATAISVWQMAAGLWLLVTTPLRTAATV